MCEPEASIRVINIGIRIANTNDSFVHIDFYTYRVQQRMAGIRVTVRKNKKLAFHSGKLSGDTSSGHKALHGSGLWLHHTRNTSGVPCWFLLPEGDNAYVRLERCRVQAADSGLPLVAPRVPRRNHRATSR